MTQIRVHELASELNVSTQQVLSFLEDLGKKVRGPSTVIGVSAAAKVRGRFRSPKSTPAADRGVVTVTESADPVASAVSSDSSAAAKVGVVEHRTVNGSATNGHNSSLSQSLFLPPVAPAPASASAPTAGAFANPFSVPSQRPVPAGPAPRPQSVPTPPRAVVNRVSPIPPPSVVPQPDPDYDALWARRGISKADQESWVEGGLRLAEADLADRCQSAGIAPSELSMKLSGRTALQRLRDGEASTSVWARIREAEQQPRRAGTKLTGRFQLS